MGVWEFIGSTAEAVKRNAPDAATPLKDAFWSSYSYGSDAFTKIDQAVRPNVVNRLGQWMIKPDDETVSKIGMYTGKFAKNAGLYALHEGYKLFPGGTAFSSILTKTLKEVEHERLAIEKRGVSEGDIRSPQKHSNVGEEVVHGGGGLKPASKKDGRCVAVASPTIDKSPEDVIRTFMMKEFFGTRFFDDLMVSELTRKKGKKSE